MKFDLATSLELTKIIGSFLFDNIATLLIHLFVGIIIGTVIAYLILRLFKAKGWLKRTILSKTKRVLFYVLKVAFFLAFIGLSSSIALIIASNKIVKKEVTHIVDEGIDYCKVNYFNDFESVEEIFAFSDVIYSKGGEVNEMNPLVAETMVDEISKKQGLGFLGSYLLKGPENEMVAQLEEYERAIVLILVTMSLEKIGAGNLLEPDQIDEAFYAWLHSDSQDGLGSINTFMSTQMAQLENSVGE
jgi:hypothetical protein